VLNYLIHLSKANEQNQRLIKTFYILPIEKMLNQIRNRYGGCKW